MAGNYNPPGLLKTAAQIAQDAETKEKTTENRQRQVQVIFNGVLAFFSIITAAAYIYQGSVMSDQLTEIRGTALMNYHQTMNAGVQARAANNFAASASSINDGIGTAVNKLNLQARELEKSVKQAARLADDTEKADRPWIGLGVINIEKVPTSEVPMRIDIPVWNGGHSPGLNVKVLIKLDVHYSAEVINQPSLIPECNKPKPIWSDSMMGGSIVLPNINSLTLFLDSPLISEPDLGCLFSSGSVCPKLFDLPLKYDFPNLPRRGIYAIGCIDYFDGAHVAHRTHIREAYWPKVNPGGIFYFCPSGNDAD